MVEISSPITTVPPGSSVTGAAYSTLATLLGGRRHAPMQDDDYDFANPTGAIEVSSTGIMLPNFPGLTQIRWNVGDMGTVYSHNDPIDSWLDITGFGIDLVQTGTARPTFKTDRSIGDGKSVVFDGVDDILIASGLALDFSAGLTVFAVIERTAFGANTEGPFLGKTTAGATTSSIFAMWWGSSSLIRFSVNRDVSEDQWVGSNAAWNTNDPIIISARYEAGTLPADDPVYLNGAPGPGLSEVGDVRPPETTINVLHMGQAFSVNLFEGEIYDWAFYTGGPMTNAQVEAVHAQLNFEYGNEVF